MLQEIAEQLRLGDLAAPPKFQQLGERIGGQGVLVRHGLVFLSRMDEGWMNDNKKRPPPNHLFGKKSVVQAAAFLIAS